jgi:hypothetical protein
MDGEYDTRRNIRPQHLQISRVFKMADASIPGHVGLGLTRLLLGLPVVIMMDCSP